jgi:hypothetical protein
VGTSNPTQLATLLKFEQGTYAIQERFKLTIMLSSVYAGYYYTVHVLGRSASLSLVSVNNFNQKTSAFFAAVCS